MSLHFSQQVVDREKVDTTKMQNNIINFKNMEISKVSIDHYLNSAWYSAKYEFSLDKTVDATVKIQKTDITIKKGPFDILLKLFGGDKYDYYNFL